MLLLFFVISAIAEISLVRLLTALLSVKEIFPNIIVRCTIFSNLMNLVNDTDSRCKQCRLPK